VEAHPAYHAHEMSVPEHPQPRASGRGLLELDPDLGQLLTGDRREAAERELRVRVTSFPIGEWDGARLADADPTHLGLLVAEGVLAREVVLADTVSTELLGPGDIIRPWHIEGPEELLAVSVRWNALSSVRLGLLDRRTAAALGRYPEINAVIVDRLSMRAQRLAVTQAISQLNRVDRRLLALFWHLAERWGRVAREGIAVPLVLSHRLIGELVGARRPTVSTALAELARAGQLVRRDDGTWLLTGQPVSLPEGESAADLVRQRRRLVPAGGEPEAQPELVVAAVDASHDHQPSARLVELRTSMRAAQLIARRHKEAFDALQADTSMLRERTVELRAERAQRIAALRESAAHGRATIVPSDD
jgi:CRP/FNR family cyclic AMP-dependent transcriptional regulator